MFFLDIDNQNVILGYSRRTGGCSWLGIIWLKPRITQTKFIMKSITQKQKAPKTTIQEVALEKKALEERDLDKITINTVTKSVSELTAMHAEGQ